MGATWKIGNDNQVIIRKDNWLTGSTHFTPFIDRSQVFLDLKVAKFINKDSGQWDNHIVNQILAPID